MPAESGVKALGADQLRPVTNLDLISFAARPLGGYRMAFDVMRQPRSLRDLTIEVELQDGSVELVNVTYDPTALRSPGMARDVQAANKGNLFVRSEAVASMVSRFLAEPGGWDVTSNGMPFEPTLENLSSMDTILLTSVLNAIIKHAQTPDVVLEAERAAAATLGRDRELAVTLGVADATGAPDHAGQREDPDRISQDVPTRVTLASASDEPAPIVYEPPTEDPSFVS